MLISYTVRELYSISIWSMTKKRIKSGGKKVTFQNYKNIFNDNIDHRYRSFMMLSRLINCLLRTLLQQRSPHVVAWQIGRLRTVHRISGVESLEADLHRVHSADVVMTSQPRSIYPANRRDHLQRYQYHLYYQSYRSSVIGISVHLLDFGVFFPFILLEYRVPFLIVTLRRYTYSFFSLSLLVPFRSFSSL